MLGQALVVTMVRAGANVLAPTHQELDIKNEIAVRKYITKHKPSYVINAVAMTDVDGCEKDPAQAELVNGKAVRFMAAACKKVKAKFIHVSTDYVFDGSSVVPYQEEDPVNPLQVYGASKTLGEKNALDFGGSVFRVQWLFGSGKANFIDWVCSNIMQGKPIPISQEQIGCPSSTLFVANILVVALATCKPGIYHVAHDQPASRFEVARYIAEYFKVDYRTFLTPVTGNFGVAERPKYTAMSTEKIKTMMGIKTMGTWQSDVLAHISARYSTWNR